MPVKTDNKKIDYSEWLSVDEYIPNGFKKKLQSISLKNDIKTIIKAIIKVEYNVFANHRKIAQSFEESRFTNFKDVLTLGLRSCGADCTIVGMSLRYLNIPVKFEHGRLKGQKGTSRHAWLAVYDFKKDKWIKIDPTTPSLRIRPNATKLMTYHNWGELKTDFKKGFF